jgi:hypothetical protein
VWKPSSSISKVASDSAVSKGAVPSRLSIAADFESALKKVWEPSSSISKVASDSAAGTVEVPISSISKVASDSALKKVWEPGSSISKVASDSAAGTVEVPISSISKVASDSALKKVWKPSSSISKVASDSAAGTVEVPISSISEVASDSALKKVWEPGSSISMVASDSAAGKVVLPPEQIKIDSSKPRKTLPTDATEAVPTPSSIRRRLLKVASSGSSNFYQVVQQITSELIAANVEPTVDIMNSLILAHSWKGDIVATQRMIDEMKLAGLEPNPKSISFLVSAYLRNSDKAGAEKAWTEALTAGLKPGMTYLVLECNSAAVILLRQYSRWRGSRRSLCYLLRATCIHPPVYLPISFVLVSASTAECRQTCLISSYMTYANKSNDLDTVCQLP